MYLLFVRAMKNINLYRCAAYKETVSKLRLGNKKKFSSNAHLISGETTSKLVFKHEL